MELQFPAERLLELNLWLATPSKPALAFTVDLLPGC